MAKPLIKKLPIVLTYIGAIVVYSFGVALFLDPAGLASSGSFGLAIIINRLFGGGTGLWQLAINVPILAIGIWKFGFRFFSSTIGTVVVSSVLIQYIPRFIPPLGLDVLPSALVGGALVGLAIGMLFRIGSSLGGSDIVVKLMRLRFKYLHSGVFYLIVDGTVVVLCGLVFRDLNNAIYAAIALCVQSYILDMTLYGTDEARMVYIVTEKEEPIAHRITTELHSGVTYLQGIGAYTGRGKQILMCAMRKRGVPAAKKIVIDEDPDAFMIVTSANQVLGRGFKRWDDPEL